MNVITIGIDLAKAVFSIHGIRAVIAKLTDKQGRLSRWARALVERRGHKQTAVALAARNARIIWSY